MLRLIVITALVVNVLFVIFVIGRLFRTRKRKVPNTPALIVKMKVPAKVVESIPAV